MFYSAKHSNCRESNSNVLLILNKRVVTSTFSNFIIIPYDSQVQIAKSFPLKSQVGKVNFD